MYIKRRQVLVAMLVMSQLGCMTFGILGFALAARELLDQIIHRSAALQAETVALHSRDGPLTCR